MPAFTVFGEPELNRTRQFVAAAKATGNKVEVISYAQVLSGNLDWRQLIESRLVRLESPGRDFLVELALLRRGESIQTDPRFAHLDQTALHALQRDPGLILATRQWYLGWQSLMEEFAKARAQSGVHFLNSPEDIMVMFDKQACHARLASAGVSVPDSLPIPANFEELAAMMIQNGWHRAFLKPSHGSAASGVVALALGNDQMMATTAVEISSTGKSTKLYSTRRLRTYRQTHEIKQLIDALCLERLHIEKWVPKAGFEGRTFDARVVVIRGRACHIIIRRAKGPITNLHLDAEKGSEELLLKHAGRAAIDLLRITAEQAASCFPSSLYMGVDIALTPSFGSAVVLEVNAFGDLLEDVEWHGADTYTWEVRAALNQGWLPANSPISD